MSNNTEDTKNSTRNSWIAITVFGVMVLYAAGLLSSHVRSGANAFEGDQGGFMASLVAFPVKSLGVWSTYLLALALASQALCTWLGIKRGKIARRTVGLVLLILGLSGLLGVVAIISEVTTVTVWGGHYGSSLASFYLSLGNALGFILALGTLGFGVFLGRDWFGYDRFRASLGKPTEEAFSLGMPEKRAETAEPAEEETIAGLPEPPDGLPTLELETTPPSEDDLFHSSESEWGAPLPVQTLENTASDNAPLEPTTDATDIEPFETRTELDQDDLEEPTAEEAAQIQIELSTGHRDDEFDLAAAEPEISEPLPTLSMNDLSPTFSPNDGETESEYRDDKTPLSLLDAVNEQASLDEAFQSEFKFQDDMPILYKSAPAEKEAEPDVSEPEEVIEEELGDELTSATEEEAVAEVNADTAEDTEEPPAEVESSKEAPADGKRETPEPETTRRRDDEWASWMGDDVPSPTSSGIAAPQYPKTASSTGGPRRRLDPELQDGYDGAVAVVLNRDQCSVSLLQRELGISFAAAAAAVEQMEKDRIVGPYQGSGHREVLLTAEAWRARRG